MTTAVEAPRAPNLTLAIPYYSNLPLLLETLRSIGAQTGAAVTALICDDSPDGLGDDARARLVAACAPVPLRIVKNPTTLGMARNWSRCLDEAETDLVTIVHGDDELEPDYARTMLALAARAPDASALFCGARIIDTRGAPRFSFPDAYKDLLIPRHDDVLWLTGERALRSLMRGWYIFCPTLCYRRAKLGALRFDPRFRMVLDVDFVTRLLLDGHTLAGLPRARMYRYRRHAENATQHLTKELTRFREESALHLDLAARAEALGWRRSARTARQRRIIQLNLLFCMARDLRGREWDDLKGKVGLFRELFSPTAAR
ncbi:MAG: glycosyltransferase [Polyangiales bacterium]